MVDDGETTNAICIAENKVCRVNQEYCYRIILSIIRLRGTIFLCLRSVMDRRIQGVDRLPSRPKLGVVTGVSYLSHLNINIVSVLDPRRRDRSGGPPTGHRGLPGRVCPSKSPSVTRVQPSRSPGGRPGWCQVDLTGRFDNKHRNVLR